MNLTKWFRKNNRKLMAVVIVIIMVGFVAGPALSYLSKRRGGENDTLAYYGDNQKITIQDRNAARRELEVLQSVGANQMLRGLSLRLMPRV